MEPIKPSDQGTPDPNTESEVAAGLDSPGGSLPGELTPARPPASNAHQNGNGDESKDWWDNCKRWFEIGGFALLLLYTTYTIRMYYANKQAADAATQAAQVAARTLKSSNDSFKETLRQMEAQTRAQKQSADAAASAASTASRQLEAFKDIEGARIGVSQPQGSIQSDQIGIPLENYGRVPSPRVWIYPHVIRFMVARKSLPREKDYRFGGDETEIPPGSGKYGITLPLGLSREEIDRLQLGKEKLWVAVSLKYDNGFGKISKMVGFCFSWNPTHPRVWDACPTFSFSGLPKINRESKKQAGQ